MQIVENPTSNENAGTIGTIKRNLTLVRSKGSPHHKTVESHYKSDEKSKKAEQATHASLGVKEVLITRLLRATIKVMKKAKKQNKQRMHPWEWRKSSSQDCWATGRRQHDEDTTRENHSGDQSEEGDNVMKTLQERTTLVIRARKESTWWKHYKREPLWWSERGRR